MATTHISLADATRDFASLIERVRSGGEEIVIESDAQPIAILKAPERRVRTIAESLERAEASSKALGYVPVMEGDFAADLEEIIRNRKPRDISAWD